jgi:hypothetical protein
VSTGFIYIVTTAGKDYQQPNLACVPTWFEGTIYFGPCKRAMRPVMNEGDYVFGISSSATHPRRILFAAKIAKKMTFSDAYDRYPKLRGPEGPIHVRPTPMPLGGFPDSRYEHIPRAIHEDDWRNDLRRPKQDAFFVCEKGGPCAGRWLGPQGPAVEGEILKFLQTCSVHGNAGQLSAYNAAATEDAPVHYGRLYTGLHLETDDPSALLKLVCQAALPASVRSGETSQRRAPRRADTRRMPRRTC